MSGQEVNQAPAIFATGNRDVALSRALVEHIQLQVVLTYSTPTDSDNTLPADRVDYSSN
jgi:hypothetical protein